MWSQFGSFKSPSFSPSTSKITIETFFRTASVNQRLTVMRTESSLQPLPSRSSKPSSQQFLTALLPRPFQVFAKAVSSANSSFICASFSNFISDGNELTLRLALCTPHPEMALSSPVQCAGLVLDPLCPDEKIPH